MLRTLVHLEQGAVDRFTAQYHNVRSNDGAIVTTDEVMAIHHCLKCRRHVVVIYTATDPLHEGRIYTSEVNGCGTCSS